MVVKDGEVLCEPSGEMLTLTQIASGGIESELQSYFDAYFTMRLDNMKVNPMILGSDAKPRYERSYATQAVA